MAVTQTMTFTATPPVIGDTPEVFEGRAVGVWNELKLTTVPNLNTAFTQMNTLETNVNAKEATVVAKEALVNPHYGAIDIVSANITSVNSVNTNIVPNLAEILLADTNAITATTKAAESLASANASALSETNAHNSELAAAALLDSFDDRYLGSKAVEPTLDNDGNALLSGALYFNTVTNAVKVYDSVTPAWISVSFIPTDHGGLTGLVDDDHTQYHNDARGDARYSPILVSGTNIKSINNESILGAGNITIGTDSLPIGSVVFTAKDLGNKWVSSKGQQVLSASYPDLIIDDNFSLYSSPDGMSTASQYSAPLWHGGISGITGANIAHQLDAATGKIRAYSSLTSGSDPVTLSGVMSATIGNPTRLTVTPTTGLVSLGFNGSTQSAYYYQTDAQFTTPVAMTITTGTPYTNTSQASTANGKVFLTYTNTGVADVYVSGATPITSPYTKVNDLSSVDISVSRKAQVGDSIWLFGAKKTIWNIRSDGWMETVSSAFPSVDMSQPMVGKNGLNVVAFTCGVGALNTQTYKSSDGGATWTTGGILSTTSGVYIGSTFGRKIEWINNRFIIQLNDGNFAVSSDNGTTWSAVAVASGSVTPNIATSYNDGATIVFVPNASWFVKTTDGITFTLIKNPSQLVGTLNKIVSIGTKVISHGASSFGATYRYSGDGGTTWSNITPTGYDNTISVSYRILAANDIFWLADWTNSKLMKSIDGITWTTAATGLTLTNASCMTYDSTLGMYLLFKLGVTSYYTSIDGITWTARTTTHTGTVSCASLNGTVVVTDDSAIATQYRTIDGINWIAITSPLGALIHKVRVLNGLFIFTTTTTGIATSPNGITWTSKTGLTETCFDMNYDAGLYTAVGTSRVMTTTDFTTWSTTYTTTSGYTVAALDTSCFVSPTNFVVLTTGASKIAVHNTTNTDWANVYSTLTIITNSPRLNMAGAKFIYSNDAYCMSCTTINGNWDIHPLILPQPNTTTVTNVLTVDAVTTVFDGTYFWKLDFSLASNSLYRSSDFGSTWTVIAKNSLPYYSASITTGCLLTFNNNGKVLFPTYTYTGSDGSSIYSDFVHLANGVWSREYGHVSTSMIISTGSSSKTNNDTIYNGTYYYSATVTGIIARSTDATSWQFKPIGCDYTGNHDPAASVIYRINNGYVIVKISSLYYFYTEDFITYTAFSLPVTHNNNTNNLSSNGAFMCISNSSGGLEYHTSLDGKVWSSAKTWQGTVAENRTNLSQPVAHAPQTSIIATSTVGTTPNVSAVISKSSTVNYIPIVSSTVNSMIKVKA